MCRVINRTLEKDMSLTDHIDTYEKTILHFTAEWCRFCVEYDKDIIRQIEILSCEYGDPIHHIRIDPRKHPEIKSLYGFLTIPHIVILFGGKCLYSDKETFDAKSIAALWRSR